MSMESADASPTASQGGKRISDVDKWLRRHLGRQLTVALLAVPEPMASAARGLADAMAAYGEIRVLGGVIGSAPGGSLATFVAVEPEIVLVWIAMPNTEGAQAEVAVPSAPALHQLLDELEARGLCDRAFVALIGPGVTRETARRLGFEDGFPSPMDPAELAATLAREGVAVDERRRRGSSPPCYL